MTGQEIADTARFIANDTAPYTKPDDPQMIKLIVLGVRLIRNVRGDSRLYDIDGTMRDLTEPTALADELDMDDRFENPLTDYVLMRIFQQKGGDKHWLERAKEHRESFLQTMKAV
jgi:hypothetical protein